MICNSPNVRLVNHCFTTCTSRTSRTGRGLQYTLKVSLMICNSPNVRLVNHCFHDPYESYESHGSWTSVYTLSLPNDMQFTNCTTREPLFHDPYESYESYESYGSWTSVYTLSLPNDMQFTNCTTREPLFHDPYE